MRHFLLLLSSFLISATANLLTAQNSLSIEWQKTFSDPLNQIGYKVLYTPNGDIVALVGGDIQGKNGNPSTPSSHYGSTILAKFSPDGNTKWWRVFPGATLISKGGNDMAQTQDGGFVITGDYWDLTDYRNLVHKALVIKTDSLGNLQWEKELGNSTYHVGTAVCQKNDGTIIVAGKTNSSDVPLPRGGDDIFVTALDVNGNVLSNYYLGGSASEMPEAITATSDGGFVIAGFSNSNDGIFAGNDGNSLGLVLKFNAANTLQWSKVMKAQSLLFLKDVIEDSDGRIVVLGSSASFGGPSIVNVDVTEYLGSTDVWIGKLNKAGDLLWQKSIGGTYGEEGYSLTELKDHSLAVCGMAGSNDQDFAANKKEHKFWVAKVDKQTGKISHQSFLGGTDFTHAFRQVTASPDGGILALTYVRDEDRNPFVADFKGGADMWLVKLQPILNTIEGNIFEDLNANGIKDAGEPLFTNGQIKLKRNANDSVLVSAKDGYFIFPVDTGKNEVSFVPTRPYYQIAPLSKSFSRNTYFNKDTVSFALTPIAGKTDCMVNVWSNSLARMGSNIDINVRYANVGTSMAKGVIRFVKDPRTEFRSATSPVVQTNDTLVLSFDALPANTSRDAVISLYVKTPPDVNWNDVLRYEVRIIPAQTDESPADNIQTLQMSIRAAYDPNDKEEITLPGKMLINQLQANISLVYRIRFQNVGNDTAFNIIVRDTIDDRLDINTLEMISADHSYTMQIKQGKYVEWYFEKIALPDSNINELRSHGYLLYRITPKKTLATDDTIKNQASVYFDYNLPVVTNTAKTTIVPDMPPIPVLTGIATSYCNNAGGQKGKITNLPAAALKATVVVLLDNTPLSVTGDSTFTFNVGMLTPGNHVITVTYANVSGAAKKDIAFAVNSLITQEVYLTANIVNVTSLATNLILSASGTGGGINPAFAFARDKSFNNFLQEYGSKSTLTINPATLAIGDNWFYVRMKTSESCYKSEVMMDSILVYRDQATGIVDPANAGQIISVAPNPFYESVTIKGLDSGREYHLMITNVKGTVIRKVSVRNQSTKNLSLPGIKAGIYWISIFDAKGRLLGTEKMIKL